MQRLQRLIRPVAVAGRELHAPQHAALKAGGALAAVETLRSGLAHVAHAAEELQPCAHLYCDGRWAPRMGAVQDEQGAGGTAGSGGACSAATMDWAAARAPAMAAASSAQLLQLPSPPPPGAASCSPHAADVREGRRGPEPHGHGQALLTSCNAAAALPAELSGRLAAGLSGHQDTRSPAAVRPGQHVGADATGHVMHAGSSSGGPGIEEGGFGVDEWLPGVSMQLLGVLFE